MIKKIRIGQPSLERVGVEFTIPEGYKYKCLREPQNLDTYIPSDRCFINGKQLGFYDMPFINKEGKNEMPEIKYLGKKRFIIEKTKAETIHIYFDQEVLLEVNIPDKYEQAEEKPRKPSKASDIFIAQDSYDDGISKEFGKFGEFRLGKIYNNKESGINEPHDIPILGKKRIIIKLRKIRYQLFVSDLDGKRLFCSYSRKSDAKRRMGKLMTGELAGMCFDIKEVYE